MSQPIDLPLDHDDRLAEPPLVDLLSYDARRGAWVVTFVPSDDVSAEATEVVTVPQGTPEFRRISALLGRVAEAMAPGRRIEKVVHSGGGSYTVWLANGESLELAEASGAIAHEVFDRIKQIADTAEAIFRVAVRA